MNPPPRKFPSHGRGSTSSSSSSSSSTTASSIQVVGTYNPSSTLDFHRRAREKGIIDLVTANSTRSTTSASRVAYHNNNKNRKRKQQQQQQQQQEPEYSLPRGGKRTKTLETTNKSQYAVTTNSRWDQGAFRWVHKGHYDRDPRKPGDTGGPQVGQPCVIKEFKTGSVYEQSFFNDDIRAVDKAAAIIQAFNSLHFPITSMAIGVSRSTPPKTVHLNRPQVWQDVYPDSTGKCKKKLVEPMLEGKFIKFNSNSGYANHGTDFMQALSHFSYHYSNRQFLLCDLQGGHYDDAYVLTDPVIMSSDNSKQFGSGDLGREGIDNFFAHHVCNDYCHGNNWCMPVQPQVSTRIPRTAGTSLSLTLGTVKSEVERKQALARVLAARSSMKR